MSDSESSQVLKPTTKWFDFVHFTTGIEKDATGGQVKSHGLELLNFTGSKPESLSIGIDIISQGKIPTEADFTTVDHSLTNVFKSFPALDRTSEDVHRH